MTSYIQQWKLIVSNKFHIEIFIHIWILTIPGLQWNEFISLGTFLLNSQRKILPEEHSTDLGNPTLSARVQIVPSSLCLFSYSCLYLINKYMYKCNSTQQIVIPYYAYKFSPEENFPILPHKKDYIEDTATLLHCNTKIAGLDEILSFSCIQYNPCLLLTVLNKRNGEDVDNR